MIGSFCCLSSKDVSAASKNIFVKSLWNNSTVNCSTSFLFLCRLPLVADQLRKKLSFSPSKSKRDFTEAPIKLALFPLLLIDQIRFDVIRRQHQSRIELLGFKIDFEQSAISPLSLSLHLWLHNKKRLVKKAPTTIPITYFPQVNACIVA